ncbi:T9SS type A sorting domain-containing protein [Flavobacteriaceae bacterium S0825]|uniref:T9SS type A sorting domain-containing protein n=1 Tax=Gaetbulibacter sp. S0825 TaxID=2720084 RepID=UPI00142FE509|nr:T9SS type A sorting domain-containing protein [Gaetbulibacter sp. S0825]MCK0107943.1 T9SS type A sorting domain-containing protein [Flavobacteriaceae bacterium S0825]NIX63579.1 T9SS type A sorting domain-containing protein [Gaetbulibacter sp. S0825]
MKKLYFLFSALFITSLSFGQLLLNENFDYGASAGDLTTVSGGNWANHSGSGSVLYTTTSLSMTGYPSTGVGGSATISSSSGEDINRTFAAQSTGTVYFGGLINISAISSGSYFFHLKDAAFNFRARIGAKDDGSGGVLFGIGASSSTLTYGTTSFSTNTTYLVIGTYNIGTGESKLYISTTVPATEPGSPEASNTGTSGTTISAVALRQASGVPNATIDGVRIGTSWNDIVTVSSSPLIEVSAAVNDLDYEFDSGPSAEGSFTVQGSNLTNDITVTAPTDFEISETSGGTFGASVTLMESGGSVSSTTIYARLKSGLAINTYSGDVTASSTGATSQTVALSGSVYATLTNSLVIAGVFDSDLSHAPRGIEIYVLEDVADLSVFGLGSANNGNGGGDQEFTFPASAASIGDRIFIASESTHFTSFFGFAPDHTSGVAQINGDDAIELFENGQIIDTFGDVDTDGSGQAWEYTDGWAYRNSTTGPDGTTFTIGNWTFSGPDALDGETTNAGATTPYPNSTYNLSTRNNSIEGFNLYPNPTSDAFVNISSDNRASIKVSVFDILGKQVIRREVTNNRLNVSNLNPGVYILRAEQNNAFTTRKLIIN